jgi:hypothetical protein
VRYSKVSIESTGNIAEHKNYRPERGGRVFQILEMDKTIWVSRKIQGKKAETKK